MKTTPLLTALHAMRAISPADRESVLLLLEDSPQPAAAAKTTTAKPKAQAKKRACTVCAKPGHDRRNCPKAKLQASMAKARAAKAAAKQAEAEEDAA
jgi:hypothetical protein